MATTATNAANSHSTPSGFVLLKSWIEVSPDCQFPLQNLPYGVFQPKDAPSTTASPIQGRLENAAATTTSRQTSSSTTSTTTKRSRPRVGVAIGDFVLDLSALADEGLLQTSRSEIRSQPVLEDEASTIEMRQPPESAAAAVPAVECQRPAMGAADIEQQPYGQKDDDAVHSRQDVDEEKLSSCFHQSSLNAFMALGPATWHHVRGRLQQLLAEGGDPGLRGNQKLRARSLHSMDSVDLLLPVAIGDYTDFYSSIHHAVNVGAMFRGRENALPPSWLHLPIAYHGRSSSIVVSGTGITRPCGQTAPLSGEALPRFGPTQQLDFELEMGCIIGVPSELGKPIPVEEAMDHIFGMVICNDWSARDIQRWEYVPLGPFLGKSFATTISPWVVPIAALLPFLTDAPLQDPSPLPYLVERNRFTFDIHLEVEIKTSATDSPFKVCSSNFKHLYWTLAQQVAHHTINGCNLNCGDLLASGTISGPNKGSQGCLLELTQGGKESITIAHDGEGGAHSTRTYLEDGDEVNLHAACMSNEYIIGFGPCKGAVLPTPRILQGATCDSVHLVPSTMDKKL